MIDALGECLVVDVGNIVDLEARTAFSGQHVLSAHGHGADVRRTAIVSRAELSSLRNKSLVSRGIELLLEAAANHRLGLITVGDFDTGD